MKIQRATAIGMLLAVAPLFSGAYAFDIPAVEIRLERDGTFSWPDPDNRGQHRSEEEFRKILHEIRTTWVPRYHVTLLPHPDVAYWRVERALKDVCEAGLSILAVGGINLVSQNGVRENCFFEPPFVPPDAQ